MTFPFFSQAIRCGQVPEKLVYIKTLLEKEPFQKGEALFLEEEEKKILQDWFHILTCVPCRWQIPSSLAQSFPQLMLDQEEEKEKHLWKLPYYLLEQGLLSSINKTNRPNRPEAKERILTPKDITEIERILPQPLYQFWLTVIQNNWSLQNKQEKLILLRGKSPGKIVHQNIPWAKAAGLPSVKPTQVFLNDIFPIPGEKVHLYFEHNPVEHSLQMGLQGGSSPYRKRLKIRIYYAGQGVDELLGEEILVGGMWTIPPNKIKQISCLEVIYEEENEDLGIGV